MGKMIEPVAIYKYNGTKYGIAIINGFINCFKYINGKISMDMNKEDLEVFLACHKSIKIDKTKSISMGYRNIDDKIFEILYNPGNCIHSWYEIKNGIRCMPSEEYNTILNKEYNDIPAVLYDSSGEIFDYVEHEKQQRRDKIHRTFTNGAMILSMFVLSGINFIAYSDCTFASEVKTKLTQIIEPEYEMTETMPTTDEQLETIRAQEYDYEEIKNAIENNRNLTEEEKEFILKFKFYFDENYEYMNLPLIVERLSSLDFRYTSESCKTPAISGLYNAKSNIIQMYNVEDMKEADLCSITHELMHVFQDIKTPGILVELSNELATREVLRQMNEKNLIEDREQFKGLYYTDTYYGVGYECYMDVEYFLAELLTREELKQYQFNPNKDILINGLSRINAMGKDINLNAPDMEAYKSRALSLLDKIEKINKYDENGFPTFVGTQEDFKDIYRCMGYYYLQKTGDKAVEQLDINLITNQRFYVPEEDVVINAMECTIDELIGEKNKKSGEIELYYMSVLPKTFFSDEHENTTVYYFNEDDICKPYVFTISKKEEQIFKNNYNIQKEKTGKRDKELE